jgi:hypothetical protein
MEKCRTGMGDRKCMTDEVLTRQCPYLGLSIHGESVGSGELDGGR